MHNILQMIFCRIFSMLIDPVADGAGLRSTASAEPDAPGGRGRMTGA